MHRDWRQPHYKPAHPSFSANFHVVFMLVPLLNGIQRERHGEILNRIAQLVDDKLLKPHIDSRQFTFENVDKAHELLESGKAIGKVVVHRECLV